MKKIPLYLLLTIILFSCKTKEKQKVNTTNSLENKIDHYISEVSKEFGIVGIGTAVIKDGKIIHKKYYGKANLAYDISFTDSTFFQLFSTTKIFSSVAIHKLIEEGKLNLEDEISIYLDDLPQAWRKVKVENLLSHSSGLPDIRFYDKDSLKVAKSKIYKDSIQFSFGEKWDYNQTNFWLLDRILEKIKGKKFAEFIIETQFKDFERSTIFNGNFSHIIKNRVTNYFDYPKQGILRESDYTIPEYLYGASGQNITLDGFIEWNRKFENNELINSDSKARIFKPFDFEKHSDFGYGWGIVKLNNELSYGFTGGKSTGYRIFPSKNMSIIFLTNGSKKGMSIDKRINRIAEIVELESSKELKN